MEEKEYIMNFYPGLSTPFVLAFNLLFLKAFSSVLVF